MGLVAHRNPIHVIHAKRKQAHMTPYSIGFVSQDSFFQSVYLTSPAPKSYKNTFTGDWNGYRRKLAEKGIIVGLSYTNNLLANPIGGLKQGFAYTDSSGLNLIFDLDKLLALHGWSFYLVLVQRNGTSLSGHYIGNLFPVSQIYGGENFRVDNMYLKEVSAGGKADFSFGRLNAGDYFLQSPMYYSFVSNAYDGNPIGVFFNVPFSAYPNSQWGAYLHVRPIPFVAGKVAIFNTNTQASQNRYHGLNLSFKGDNGVMAITEWGLMNDKDHCFISCKLPGRYTVGFIYFSGKDQINFVTNKKVKGNYGFYYQLEQKLYQPGFNALRGLSTFFVMEFFPDKYNKIPLFFDTGLIYRGIFLSRPRDFLALGFVYGKFSNNLREKERASGMPVQQYEENIELNYRIFVTPWLFIQPDIQYIIKPNGYSHIPNAFVYGGQMGLEF